MKQLILKVVGILSILKKVGPSLSEIELLEITFALITIFSPLFELV